MVWKTFTFILHNDDFVTGMYRIRFKCLCSFYTNMNTEQVMLSQKFRFHVYFLCTELQLVMQPKLKVL